MRPILTLAAVLACAVGAWPQAIMAQVPAILRPSNGIEAQPQNPQQRPPVITAVAIVPGGKTVATAGDDHLVRLWSTTTGQLLFKLQEHSDWVRALAVSPDGMTLASAGDDHRVVLWELSTGKKLHSLPPHPHVIYSLAFSPDGKLLATAGFESKVRVYDVEKRALPDELEGPGVDLRTVAFSADGTRLAAAGRSGKVRVWKIPGGDVDLEIPSTGVGRLRTLAWLPDGQMLVTAGENRIVAVWDAHTGAPLRRIQCPAGKLLSMVVCGDTLLATGGSDNVIRVWNWQDEIETEQLVGHTGSVASLAYDPASGTIISGSFDTTVRVWKLKRVGPGQDTAVELNQESRVR